GEPVVAPDGSQPGVPGMTVDADLWPVGDDRWQVVDRGRTLAELPADHARLCVSWTAEVVRSEDERRLIDEHLDDLTVERIDAIFTEALAERDLHVPDGVDLLTGPRGLALLARAFSITPVEPAAPAAP